MSPKSPPKKRTKPPGFVEGLKTEWNLFWDTILGDDENPAAEAGAKDPFVTGKLQSLNLEQVKAITKALSSDRRKLNQRMEELNRQIEENSQRLESLKLVGGESDETMTKINELNDLGQTLSEQLDRINERLKLARSREDAIKKAVREA